MILYKTLRKYAKRLSADPLAMAETTAIINASLRSTKTLNGLRDLHQPQYLGCITGKNKAVAGRREGIVADGLL
jgi:hypothetical protein